MPLQPLNAPFAFDPAPSLGSLDGRARDIFRRIVETYLETGEPVGSRTMSRAGVQLSPASIRNTMQDLAALGLLDAPHASAGRMPTHAGLRLFVDGLLEVGDVSEDERRAIEERLGKGPRNVEEALTAASALLSGLAGGAAVVTAPARDAGVKHVEFVALGGGQTLAVMVFGGRHDREPADGDAHRPASLRPAGSLELHERPPARPHAGRGTARGSGRALHRPPRAGRNGRPPRGGGSRRLGRVGPAGRAGADRARPRQPPERRRAPRRTSRRCASCSRIWSRRSG